MFKIRLLLNTTFLGDVERGVHFSNSSSSSSSNNNHDDNDDDDDDDKIPFQSSFKSCADCRGSPSPCPTGFSGSEIWLI